MLGRYSHAGLAATAACAASLKTENPVQLRRTARGEYHVVDYDSPVGMLVCEFRDGVRYATNGTVYVG